MDCQLLSTKAKFEVVWDTLKQLNISSVTASFDGSGDSGQINDVCPDHEKDEPDADYDAKVSLFLTTVVTLNGEVQALHTLIEELTHDFITQHEDWWNNDGGYGEAIWYADDDPPRIDVEINVRIVTAESYSHEFDRHGNEAA